MTTSLIRSGQYHQILTAVHMYIVGMTKIIMVVQWYCVVNYEP